MRRSMVPVRVLTATSMAALLPIQTSPSFRHIGLTMPASSLERSSRASGGDACKPFPKPKAVAAPAFRIKSLRVILFRGFIVADSS
jgi:hypothetical protein